jgi:hypothetical protein
LDAEETEFQTNWARLVKKLERSFGEGLDVEGILFLVGIQELGRGPVTLSKKEKMDVLHVAVCALLVKYNYYTFIGRDEEGWPHFEETDKLPHLKPMQQHRLIKEAIIEYFKEEY